MEIHGVQPTVSTKLASPADVLPVLLAKPCSAWRARRAGLRSTTRGAAIVRHSKKTAPQTLSEMKRVSVAQQRAKSAEELYEEEHATFTRFTQELEDKWTQRFDALAARARAAGVSSEDVEAIRAQTTGTQERAGIISSQPMVRWHDDDGLHRRFEIIGHDIDPMNGVFHLDGIFEGAARYRSCKREDWWILKKGDLWRGCGHPRVEDCTQCPLPGLGSGGRRVDSIEEIADASAVWEPARFVWVR